MTPNSKVIAPNGGQPVDINFTTSRLGLTTDKLTYVAITARSYHPGGVNALNADGSVRFVKDTIAQVTWRALGTRGGLEVCNAEQF